MSQGWGYSTVADAEEFLESYEALIEALLQSEPVQGFCYTQLTDVEQEVNGLLTYDRKPKAALEKIREITTRREPEVGRQSSIDVPPPPTRVPVTSWRRVRTGAEC